MLYDNIVVSDTYQILTEKVFIKEENHILYAFWKTKALNKIIIFSWLVYHNRNLVWENLQKRNSDGPGIRWICKNHSEDNDHILLHCLLTTWVWKKILPYLASLIFSTPVLEILWNGGALKNLPDELSLFSFSGTSGSGRIESSSKIVEMISL